MPSLAALLQVGLIGLATGSASATALILGVSYGPVPLKNQDGASALPQDDWMSEQAVPMWGRAGRGDLRIIRQLGANAVRLYGNNPTNSHVNFLDEAWSLGLRILPGMSDHPYYQQVPGSCQQSTDYDCFSQIKPMYAQNLERGFLTVNRTYHPALEVMNIINEPDLKMPSDATSGGTEGLIKMCRSIISAFDAMLDAEQDLQVTGPLINFTATFSYAICSSCERFAGNPALGQMAQLEDAMNNPEKYGYRPRNDIAAAYRARWTHSFNTQNPATDLQHQFLDGYVSTFPATPVYIGEYHRVGANQTEDLSIILDIASRNSLFLGISFFQYQVAYWKSGSEMEFGMFGLTDQVIEPMPYFGTTYDIYCLDPVVDKASGAPMPNAVAAVYGGPGVGDAATLCAANPWGVPLDHTGFAQIAHQNSVPQMARFVRRIVEHLGATVADENGLDEFAKGFIGTESSSFAPMMALLGERPWWTQFDPEAKCLADRTADPVTIGNAIGWACSQAKTFSCDSIPEFCKRSTYTTADYVFSRFYEELAVSAGTNNPLQSCSFSDSALLAGALLSSRWTGALECAAGGAADKLSWTSVTRTTTGADHAATSTAQLRGTTTTDVARTTTTNVDATTATVRHDDKPVTTTTSVMPHHDDKPGTSAAATEPPHDASSQGAVSASWALLCGGLLLLFLRPLPGA
uniref:X8 domain-containing protein n=1 Tax=Pyrodinium bahamense TaxID=73915 RepID=A0A7S0FSV7_9DINO|mmetsp:Transcript_44726/g.124345  ORF Transcript_44726/g.124345 Transcript_44726/m.124345 type:complete len:690 (+) Transcript_44726:46-2115(+)